jgi:hypothetical protein
METPAPLYVVRRQRRPFAIWQYFFGVRHTHPRRATVFLPKAIWTPAESRAVRMTREDADKICDRFGGTVLPSTEKETK